MFVAFDLFRGSGTMMIYARKDTEMSANGKTVPCRIPWTQMDLDSEEEELLFKCVLRGIIFSLKEEYHEFSIEAVFIIPHNFSYIKRAKIKRIALDSGINSVRCGYGIEYEAYAVYPHTSGVNFFLQINPAEVEIGVIDAQEDIVEVLGINHIRNCYERDPERFYRQFYLEVKQMLHDIEHSWDDIEHLFVFCDCSASIITHLEQITYLEQYSGKNAVRLQNLTVGGALKFLYNLYESDQKIILLHTIPYDLSLTVDSDGERKVSLFRYTSTPTLGCVPLKTTDEAVIKLYEGNFPNSEFNTCLCTVRLDNAYEGQNIECQVDVAVDERIKLSIKMTIMSLYLKSIYAEKICYIGSVAWRDRGLIQMFRTPDPLSVRSIL